MERCSMTRRFLQGSLAQRLFAVFLLASLLPVVVSDAVSIASLAQIVHDLAVDSRERTTRQVGRQVYERLLAGETLLRALPPSASSAAEAPQVLTAAGPARVFRHVEAVGPPAPASSSAQPLSELARAWEDAPTPAAGFGSHSPLDSPAGAKSQIRVASDREGQARVLMRVSAANSHPWIAEFDAAQLWAPLVDANLDSEWKVTDGSGRLIAHHTGDDHDTDLTQADSDLIETRSLIPLAGDFGIGEWVLVQRSPRPVVLWQGHLLPVWFSLVALFTILAAALFGRWQLRRALAPLQQLTEGTRRLAAGAIQTRVAVEHPDEIGALAGAFNDMATHIQAQFDALQGSAAIDRAILAGMPFEHLAQQALTQLAAALPGATASVSWREGVDTVKHLRLEAADGELRPVVGQLAELTSELGHCFSELTRDRSCSVSDAPLPRLLHALPSLFGPASSAVQAMTLLPLRHQASTKALLALGFHGAAPLDKDLQPARELRDRLAIGWATRAREHELTYQATHDSLTGLKNRYGLHAELDAMLAENCDQARIAVLAIDLDQFKDVNDSHGHEVGDELLRQASHRLTDTVPADCLVARQGGDEFLIVLRDTDEVGACKIASLAIAALSQPFALRDAEQVLGASIGIAFHPEHGRTRDELLRSSDVALYAAKAAGRRQYAQFTAALDAQTHERIQVINDLRLAIQRSEFVAHYQPRIRPIDGAITSAEALIRWQHPRRGLLLPGSFIAHAESSGLIEALGLWILDAACAQMARWRAQGVAIERVSVNVSPRQLDSGRLLDEVRAALSRHALPGHVLELEVTESLLAGDMGSACAQLHELRRCGVTLAIDDFGTGYSSMATLRQLPIDVLKIDRSFVKDLGIESSSLPVVRAIATLAREMGLTLVAEGVETNAQVALLEPMRCEELQGNLYSAPVSAEVFATLPGLRWSEPVEAAGVSAP
jgi:diguanylate cyclase